MQLNVREVARIFEVPETLVDRWMSQHQLPYREVSGQRFFDRSELLEWATAHQIKFTPSLIEAAAFETRPLADALDFGGILEHVAGNDKASVLRNAIRDLPLPDGFDREGLLHLLLAREQVGTTAVGDGIAIPHVRHPMIMPVERPILRLCFLSQPIDFGAPDRLPVQTLFLLISPTIRSHLRFLAAISQALRDSRFRDAIRRRAGREAILHEARRMATESTMAVDSQPNGSRVEDSR